MVRHRTIECHLERWEIMKIKVGDKVYDGEKEPVMIILSERDKDNITSMDEYNTKYCCYPETEEWTKDDFAKIKKWMKEI